LIYFIESPAMKALKIGVAVDVQRRFHGIQCHNADKLRLLGVIAGWEPHEREWHQRLREHRIRGEWFHTNEEVMSAVRAAIDGYHAALNNDYQGCLEMELGELLEDPLQMSPDAVAIESVSRGVRRLREAAMSLAGVAYLEDARREINLWADRNLPPAHFQVAMRILDRNWCPTVVYEA
jgi:hypothetical protein